MPRVSVIVPVYNGERTIDECVSSILASSYPRSDFELLLVDNASTDRTPEILTRFKDHATILHEATRGPAAARNRGLQHAAGDVVAFTDADCIVHRDWLREIVAPVKDPSVGIAGGTIRSRQPSNAVETFGERIHDQRMAIEHYWPPYAITMNWASPRAVLEGVGPFDPQLLRCEDCDLAYRILQAGYRLVYAPEAVVYHRNERNWMGLIAEGYAHGYHSIPLLKKHDEFVRTCEANPPPPQTNMAPIANDRTPTPEHPEGNEALYWRIFNLGKAAGKMVGSWREKPLLRGVLSNGHRT